jgi:hypothetical protein
MARTPFDRLASFLCALLFLAGCGAREQAMNGSTMQAPKPVTALDVEAARVVLTGAARGAQGPGPALLGDAPAGKQLPALIKQSLKGEIEPWLFAWRVGLGTFRVDQLANTGTRPLAEGGLEPFDGNAPGEDLRLLHLALPSPGGETVLDPYLDWTLTAQGEHVIARRDGRAAVAVIDLRSKVRQRLLDARPPFGRFDGAMWLDAQRCVLYAAERFDANPWRGGPVLYVVDMVDGTVTRYQGPGVDFAGFKLVEKDLERRFRLRMPNLRFS